MLVLVIAAAVTVTRINQIQMNRPTILNYLQSKNETVAVQVPDVDYPIPANIHKIKYSLQVSTEQTYSTVQYSTVVCVG